MTETDWTDRHVARWHDHRIDVQLDDEVEGIVVRIGRLARSLKKTMEVAVAEVGLQEFEYQTLHSLMIRDTPGTASTAWSGRAGYSAPHLPATVSAWSSR